ncbi:CHAT domain-containing protein [Neorhizobium tomejilense]|uniref:CHAT domain-containing protein n=1 Tax=Neorhizobium tomejilense TaxID=2093828 RepID=UPI003ECC65DD
MTYDIVSEALLVAEQKLQRFCHAVNDWTGHTDEDRASFLAELKEMGRDLTAAFFAGEAPLFVERLSSTRSKIVEQVHIGITQQLPLDFCLLEANGEEFFLGERYLCPQTLSTRTDAPLRNLIAGATGHGGFCPVGYAEDDELPSACKTPASVTRPHVEEFAVISENLATGVTASVLPGITSLLTSDDLKALRKWISARYQVLHINSHVKRQERNRYRPHLQLRSKALVGSEHLNLPSPEKPDFTGTFVFLNGCGTVIGSTSFNTSVARHFLKYNASGITCTTGPVDDAFATEFARELYTNLNGKRMSARHAVIATRAAMTERKGHPMALLYTYIGQDDLVLKQGNAA